MDLCSGSVLQYTVVRPAISIVGIICQAYNILCEQSWNYKYASVYLSSIDFVSITYVPIFLHRPEFMSDKSLGSVALYGLVSTVSLWSQFRVTICGVVVILWFDTSRVGRATSVSQIPLHQTHRYVSMVSFSLDNK